MPNLGLAVARIFYHGWTRMDTNLGKWQNDKFSGND
jgi:hypothetical protein